MEIIIHIKDRVKLNRLDEYIETLPVDGFEDVVDWVELNGVGV